MKVMKVESDEQLRDAFKVRTKVFVHEQGVPNELEIDEHENDSTHFVMYHEDEPIGAGRFRVLEGKGKVERICVLSAHRGTGAGNQIMNTIENFAKPLAIKSLILNAQISALPFYEKLGYTVISDEFLDAGIPHKTMEKML